MANVRYSVLLCVGCDKPNLWVYGYVHPIYKTATQQIIYNQLVHPMETHDMGIVYAKTDEWSVEMSLMMTMIAAYYPPPMGDSQVGHRRSAGSHKHRG